MQIKKETRKATSVVLAQQADNVYAALARWGPAPLSAAADGEGVWAWVRVRHLNVVVTVASYPGIGSGGGGCIGPCCCVINWPCCIEWLDSTRLEWSGVKWSGYGEEGVTDSSRSGLHYNSSRNWIVLSAAARTNTMCIARIQPTPAGRFETWIGDLLTQPKQLLAFVIATW